jgi:hypothetical protein
VGFRHRRAELALANPFVEDQSHLRPTLVMGLLDVAEAQPIPRRRVSHLCETGRVFIERNGHNLECAAVAFVIAEPVGERKWLKSTRSRPISTPSNITSPRSPAAAGIDLPASPSRRSPAVLAAGRKATSASAGDIDHGWTARFGLLNLAMVKSLGIEGKVYAGIFAILPEKISGDTSRRRNIPTSACCPPPCAISRWSSMRRLRSDRPKDAREARPRCRRQHLRARVCVSAFDVYTGARRARGQTRAWPSPRVPLARPDAHR